MYSRYGIATWKTVAQNKGIKNMQIIFSIRVNIKKTTTKILHYSILLFWTVSKREVHEFMIIVCDPLEKQQTNQCSKLP